MDERGPNDGPNDVPDAVPGARRGKRQDSIFPDDEARVRDALDKLPPDTRTRIKRVNDLTKRYETHGILSPEEVSTEWVAKRFGGGRYIIEVLRRADSGKEVIDTTATWHIPGKYLGVGDGLPGINEQPNGGAQAPIGPGGHSAPIATRELIDSALASRVMDLLARDNKPAVNWEGVAAMLGAIGTIVSPVIVAMVERSRDRASDPLDEIRRELTALKNKPGPTSGALNDAMKGVKQILELKELVAPDGGGKASATERLVELLPGVLEAFAGRRVAPPVDQDNQTMTIEQPPERPSLGAMPDGATPSTVPAYKQLLQAYASQLVGIARAGWEPDFSAELVARLVPNEYGGLLKELLRKPDAVALVTEAIPELAQYESWLPDFVKELRAQLLGDEGEEGATDG